MTETRRTKDWITPEILEKTHQQHQLMAREAINTSDQVGVPIAEAPSILATFIPNIEDILSLRDLFDARFFKLFFIGVGISGILALCTIGSQRFYSSDPTDWNAMYNAGRSQKWMRNYDEAEKCFKAAVTASYSDKAAKSFAYGELADLARRRGNTSDARQYELKETEYSQAGSGFGFIVMACLMLFIVSLTSVFMFRCDKNKKVVGWHQPAVVAIATYAISAGVHNLMPFIPLLGLCIFASAIAFVVLVLSASVNGGNHPHFVTPSRE